MCYGRKVGIRYIFASNYYDCYNIIFSSHILYNIRRDMSEPLLPFQCIYNFAKIDLKYGHIVVPSLNNNWGPMYFCKMVKVR